MRPRNKSTGRKWSTHFEGVDGIIIPSIFRGPATPQHVGNSLFVACIDQSNQRPCLDGHSARASRHQLISRYEDGSSWSLRGVHHDREDIVTSVTYMGHGTLCVLGSRPVLGSQLASSCRYLGSTSGSRRYCVKTATWDLALILYEAESNQVGKQASFQCHFLC